MKLTVLGSGPAWPSAGQASSGYLLGTEAGAFMLECGTGVFERLRERLRPAEIRAILISHLHFDHWVDLVPFKYHLDWEAEINPRPRLYLPPEGAETLRRVVEPVSADPRFFSRTFDVQEYDPEETLVVEDLCVSFLRTEHPVPTYAMRIECGAKVLTFSSDTGWGPPLHEFAEGSDLPLCEAAWGKEEDPDNGHLSGGQAGQLARLTGTKRLLLTHLARPKIVEAISCARGDFDGEVLHAGEGLELPL